LVENYNNCSNAITVKIFRKFIVRLFCEVFDECLKALVRLNAELGERQESPYVVARYLTDFPAVLFYGFLSEILLMKKTLLAAALLAGFAGVAQAQNTSVTLYGIIDVGLGYNKIKVPNAGSRSSIGMRNGVQSGSRWGLRGSEDLGDGLRAVFQLENGFSLGNGRIAQGGRLFGRQATLGLASDSWGQLDFGRQTNVGSKYFGSIDPFAAAFTQSNLGHGIGSVNTRRLSNMVMYRTPDIAGFQFGIGYSFNTEGRSGAVPANPRTAVPSGGFKTRDNVRSLTAGLRYLNGPLNVAASYDQARDSDQNRAASRGAKPKVYAIGAAYDFEVVKVAAAYGRTSDGWLNGQNALDGAGNFGGVAEEVFAKGFRANSYMLGLTAPIADGSKVFTSWQRIKPKNTRLTGDDETSNVYSVGYTYDFSKRTNLYAYTSYVTDYAFLDGVKSTAVAVGLRHRF